MRTSAVMLSMQNYSLSKTNETTERYIMSTTTVELKRYFWILLFGSLVGCSSHAIKEVPKDSVPVLFVPGFGETGDDHEKWTDLKKLFKSKGYNLKVAHMPRFTSIDDGTKELLDEIKRHFPNENIKFHIIAKSMGGLSARKALHMEKDSMKNRVLSLSTISTPHHGTEIADNYLNPDNREWCIIPSELAEPFLSIFQKLGLNENGLTDAGSLLSPNKMIDFNNNVKDVSGIEYFSFRYKIDCDGSLCNEGNRDEISWTKPYPTNPLSACLHDIIYKRTGEENDGIVTLSSAKWGTPIGIYEGEHIALTLKPSLFNAAFSRYKNKEIWHEVFERVLDNLSAQKTTHPDWP